MKTVYVAMSSDVIHEGILNVINHAAKLSDVTVGLLTDEVIAAYKRVPLLDYSSREQVYASLKGVSRVVRQDSLSYRDNLISLKPHYVVHGDD